MSASRRWLAGVPMVLGLAWLVAASFDAMTADRAVRRAAALLQSSESATAEPGLRRVEAELRQALSRQPGDPTTHELLAQVASRRGDAESALASLRSALELRPVSGYAWAAFAEAAYRTGDTGVAFEASLANAVKLGPHEPAVQRTVALYALATWSQLDAPARAAVEKMVAAGMRRAPGEMLQIGERRGRLGVVCRHLDGPPRQIDPKWLQRCKSTEAT